MKKLVIYLSPFLLLAACAEKKSVSTRWHAHAPTSQAETGVVVQLNSANENEAFELRSQIEKLMDKKDSLEVREINQTHGMYEFYNIKQEELDAALKTFNVKSYQNVYFKNMVPKAHASSAQSLLKAISIDTCVKSEVEAQQPDAIVVPTSLVDQLSEDMPIINLKDGAVSFTATKSVSFQTDKTLDQLWLIQGPPGSAFEEKLVNGLTLSFTPDLPGSYSIGLVVQDTAKNCTFTGFDFGVTYNQEFAGPKAPRTFDMTSDRSQFFHLDEVGGIEAWKQSKGDDVVIAVIDTGVNYNHPDLRANILTNPKEIPNNYFDDDGNGYVDDVAGWDFANKDSMPIDDGMHGTHVAGIAASAVTGVAPNAKILAIKVLNAFGGGDLASIKAGMLYAVDRGANVINLSLGMDTFAMTPSQIKTIANEYRTTLEYAKTHNVIVAAAAGNGFPQDEVFEELAGKGYNIEKYPHLPSSIASSNLIAISSVDSAGALAVYSNYSATLVQVAAPGGAPDMNPDDEFDSSKPILAAYYWPSIKAYEGLMGTSMATPVVAGALAVLKSAYPKALPVTLISTLQGTSVKKAALTGKVKSGGVINIPAALTALSKDPAAASILSHH